MGLSGRVVSRGNCSAHGFGVTALLMALGILFSLVAG